MVWTLSLNFAKLSNTFFASFRFILLRIFTSFQFFSTSLVFLMKDPIVVKIKPVKEHIYEHVQLYMNLQWTLHEYVCTWTRTQTCTWTRTRTCKHLNKHVQYYGHEHMQYRIHEYVHDVHEQFEHWTFTLYKRVTIYWTWTWTFMHIAHDL